MCWKRDIERKNAVRSDLEAVLTAVRWEESNKNVNSSRMHASNGKDYFADYLK